MLFRLKYRPEIPFSKYLIEKPGTFYNFITALFLSLFGENFEG